MSEWKNKFRRSDDDEAKSSEAKYGCFRLCVHHYIGYPNDMWLASCYPGLLDRVRLESKNLEEAKCQAKAMLQVKLEEALKSIANSKT